MNPGEHSGEELIFICPSYLDCVLAAADSRSLDALRAWAASLPMKSYGRVFIEINPAEITSVDLVEDLATPPGVGVTWITRDAAILPGRSALVTAVDAWLDEWLRGDPLSGRHVQLWVGNRADDRTHRDWSRIENELAETWAAAVEYQAQSF